MIDIPQKYLLVAGKGTGCSSLNAFDAALRDAGVGNVNLVKMSSIIPPHCRKVSSITLPYGAIVPAAYASLSTEGGSIGIIGAGVAAAFPEDENLPALVMEHEDYADKERIEKTVREMAISGLENRGWKVKKVESIAIDMKVEKVGAVFAAVILWY